MNACRVSVVIPTYQREQVLLDTVRALLKLSEPPDEVLVVDQTEKHSTPVESFFQALEKNEGNFPDVGRNEDVISNPWKTDKNSSGTTPVRRVRLSKPSVPHAMNVGLKEANGTVVLFLDDDIIPDENLISKHWQTHEIFSEARAVVGQVLQPEDERENAEMLKIEELKTEKLKAETLKSGNTEMLKTEKLKAGGLKPEISKFQLFKISGFHDLSLCKDLDFAFNSGDAAWVENVMAGNLSVKRMHALEIGGFDENFVPPVSYRFETEFARRLIAAGGRIRFEPSASIRHLRAGQGGTRSRGSHLTSISPVHGVGDYYYALKCGRGSGRLRYMLRRPFREVCTRFHLRHPWWIPVKFIGECRALLMALKLIRKNGQVGTR